jgi:hypothetical protein
MGRTPFYQRPRFLAVAAVVALGGGILSLTGAPSPWKVVSDLLSDDVAAYNTMIVVDASGGMRERFGNGTKYDAATEAVEDYVRPLESQGFGLRTFGGACDEVGERRVDVAADHNDDVTKAVKDVDPGGKANLSTTLTAAIDDLSRKDKVPGDSGKQILVFTGSADTCGQNTAADLRRQMKQVGVSTVFKIVAVKPSAKSAQKLRTLKRRLGDAAELEIATTQDDLDEAVDTVQREATTTPAETTTAETTQETTETTNTTETTSTTETPTTETPTTPPPETEPGG